MRVGYITNARSQSGVGSQAVEVAKRFPNYIELVRFHIDGEAGELRRDAAVIARVPQSLNGAIWRKKSLNWLRLGWKLAGKEKVDVWHATNQTLSFVLPHHGTSIVTVHDVIERLEPQSWGSDFLARYLYSGISRATKIVAVSDYTKREIMDLYKLPEEQITVIYNGVGETFQPLSGFVHSVGYHVLCQELQLSEDAQVVLLVGSDHPRKNIRVALEAFAKVRQENPRAVLVKVGAPGLKEGRTATLRDIDRLGLRDKVRLVNQVSVERLNELYNLAQVLIFPSRYEGFGLPVVEAFACGVPVVASNATALPEIIADAGLLHEPDDVAGFARDVLRVLSDPVLAQELKQKGITRAGDFSWERAARETSQVYQSLMKNV